VRGCTHASWKGLQPEVAEPVAADAAPIPGRGSRALAAGARGLLPCAARLRIAARIRMIETNPIRFRIADLRARLSSLRGYL